MNLFIFIAEELLSLANILALLFFNLYMTSTTFFIKFISSVGRHLVLNPMQLDFTRKCGILFNKYPALYKVMDYFFSILATFHLYLYSIVFKLNNIFKNNFPLLYSIAVYIYSEYIAILEGKFSSNIKVIIGLKRYT